MVHLTVPVVVVVVVVVVVGMNRNRGRPYTSIVPAGLEWEVLIGSCRHVVVF
jgi:hypothetical protein